MKAVNLAGWGITTLGLVLWLYGYSVIGVPPLFAWQANAPAWISEFLPNLQAEIGFALMIVGSVPVCWVMVQQRG